MKYLPPSVQSFKAFNVVNISDIEDALIDENGYLRCLSAKELLSFGFDRLRLFMHVHAIYQMPTVELIEKIKNIIGDKTCIEIGAGHGDIGRHLNIKMTDSHQQLEPHITEFYKRIKQPIINYPSDVEKLDYKAAIEQYKPDIVLGCWVTHKYNPDLHHLGGNEAGMELSYILKHVKQFVFVGNHEVHKNWQFEKNIHCYDFHYIDGIVSRASTGRNFIGVFDG